MTSQTDSTPGVSSEAPLSIAQLNWYIKNVLENSLPPVWVEGEVTDLSRPSSGHLYFSLKDDQSQIRAVIWRSAAQRLPFALEDGLAIICRASVDVYPPRGSYQLVINQVHPKGLGTLQLAFQQLHRQLESEGLFAAERKRPLPKFPQRIAFVTSPSGAALHDFLESSSRLWSEYALTVIPTRVQGAAAAGEIVDAMRLAHRVRPKFDLLLIGRGGGSMEDLWCFNEERVVRAISKCRMPTVTAIGHEIDVTLADMAADARALTPSQAAQLILPSRIELEGRLQQTERRLHNLMRNRLQTGRLRLESLTERGMLARPHELHIQRRQSIDDLEARSTQAIWRWLQRRREQLQATARAAEALSPLSVLARGYSLTQASHAKSPLADARDVSPGDLLDTRLARGRVRSQVVETHLEDNSPAPGDHHPRQ